MGEDFAAEYLSEKGYEIIERNFNTRLGEIDIVAQKKGQIVFVEVKRRATLEYGRPVEAVNLRKQNKIKKVAEMFLVENKAVCHDCRFDVIEILDEEISHIENAF